MSDNRKPDIYVLWTGGWDSTFRMVQIQKEPGDKPIVVQPVYISENGRKSENIEIERMQKMLPMLREIGPNDFLDLMIIKRSEIPENEQISEAYGRLNKLVRLGSQYDWIARLAVQYPGIEVGIEKPNGEYGGCSTALSKYGKLVFRDNSYFVDKAGSTDEINLVLGNLSYPILMITEEKMIELIHEWHCDDLMTNIWFCHTPIDGKPCGYCRPCQQKMESNMEWLIPESGQKRYRFFKRAAKIVSTRYSYKVTGWFCK